LDKSADEIFGKTDAPILWNLSLLSFIIAGVTGFCYRLGMTGGAPFNLSMINIRHAHSHLMFFGWAVPMPLYFLFDCLKERAHHNKGIIKLMKYSIVVSLLLGLTAYPFFLLYGYRPVSIGSAALPVSAMLAGLVMVSWYCFMFGYFKIRHVLDGDPKQLWVDGAIAMLLVCSLGAWGVAVMQAISPANQLLTKAMTHFFLSTFTEGWVVLILVAIIISQLERKKIKWPLPPNLLLALILLGAPLTFPYGIPESLLSSPLLMIARIGGAVAATSLLLILTGIVKSINLKNSIWIWPIGLLGFKALMQLTASILPTGFWLSDHGLRILYLHVLLLGALTLTIAATLNEKANIPKPHFKLFVGAVVSVLASLVLLSRFWPMALSGSWIYETVASVAILPVLAAINLWFRMLKKKSEKAYARHS